MLCSSTSIFRRSISSKYIQRGYRSFVSQSNDKQYQQNKDPLIPRDSRWMAFSVVLLVAGVSIYKHLHLTITNLIGIIYLFFAQRKG